MIRTRIAPSPTGDPHMGTAFVALMNAMHAQRHGGTFVLRIEDTDRVRSSAASEAAILSSLRWLGLTWDEGPDVGGPHGPYRQSDRLDHYAHAVDTLLESGAAFRCFCTEATLEAMRADQRANNLPPRYDGRCASLTKTESDARAAAGEAFVVRMRMPTEGTCTFDDTLRGSISIDWKEMDMFILQKSDGWPTYHLANVVDDHAMAITDVIRGEEWISSTPKHIAIYEAFGWTPPRFHHLPLLRNPDKSKLSKRRNPTSITHYARMGYLPNALAAYLSALAVRDVNDADLLDPAKRLAGFALDNLSPTGPVFDVSKLDWMNGQAIRALSPAAFRDATLAFLDADRMQATLDLAQSRITRLTDLAPLTGFLFSGALPLTQAQLLDGKLDADTLARCLARLSIALDAIDWNDTAVEDSIRAVAEAEGVALKAMIRHLYTVVSGTPTSLPVFQSITLLGRDMMRVRLATARALLPTLSKKQLEALQ